MHPPSHYLCLHNFVDDRQLAIGAPGAIRLYSLSEKPDLELTHDVGRPDGRFIYLTHSQQMFAAVTDRAATFWDFKSGSLCGRIQFNSNEPTRLAVSLHSEIVATAGSDHLVKIWDPRTGNLQGVIKGHSNTVYGVDWAVKWGIILAKPDRSI